MRWRLQVGRYGIKSLGPLGYLILVFYGTCIVFVFGVFGLIAWFSGFSIVKFLYYIFDEIVVVLATSSSDPALPTLMEKMEKLGCSKSLVGLVVPTGYTFNTDGSSLYMTMRCGAICRPGHEHSFGFWARAAYDSRRGRAHFQRSGKRCDRSGFHRSRRNSDGHTDNSRRRHGTAHWHRPLHEHGPRHCQHDW